MYIEHNVWVTATMVSYGALYAMQIAIKLMPTMQPFKLTRTFFNETKKEKKKVQLSATSGPAPNYTSSAPKSGKFSFAINSNA